MKYTIPTVVAAIAASLMTVYAIGPGAAPGTQHKQQSTYDRVMASGQLRCGYTLYSVGLNRDPNTGELWGIYKDITEEIARMLGLEVVWAEEVGWGEQIEGLNFSRYDMVCSPANITGPRTRSADVTTAFYYSPVYAWARQDDARFKAGSEENLARANKPDIKIATIDGEQAEAQAQRFFPKAGVFSAPQSVPFSNMFINVAQGKADIAIAEPTAVYEFMQNNNSTLVPINKDDPLILAVNIMIVKSGELQFKAMINNALTELIANGFVNQTINRWEKFSNSYIRRKRTL